MNALDLAVLVTIALALLRGMWIGLTKEVFSLGALAAACFAVWLFAPEAGRWLAQRSGLAPPFAVGICGFAIGVGALAAVVVAGNFAQRGVAAAGLRRFDRVGGGILGTAEGVIVATLLLLVATKLLGSSDALVANSKSSDAFRTLQDWVLEQVAPAEEDFPEERALRARPGGARAARGGGVQWPQAGLAAAGGSTQRPCLRSRSTSRSSASALGTWRSTQSWPT